MASIIDYAALLTCTTVGISLMAVCGVLIGVGTRDDSRLQRAISLAILLFAIGFGLYMAVWSLDSLVESIMTKNEEG